MNADEVIRELRTLEQRLSSARLLDREGKGVLTKAVAQLQWTQPHTQPWQCEIDRDEPLVFRETNPAHVKYKMRVDLFGRITRPADGVPSGEHSIVVRVWCNERNVWFNKALDAEDLHDEIATDLGRRVMLRFRFDYAPPKMEEPWCHLQIGGQQRAKEFFRMPDNLGVPRFLHYPMNIAMACEFVIRHFYPEDYDTFSSEPNVRDALRAAHKAYLQKFLARVGSYKYESDVSFLQHMWDQG